MQQILMLLICTMLLIPDTSYPMVYQGPENIVEDVVPEFDEDDVDLIARVVMSEASICCYEEKVAIATVVINRVRSSKFPDTVSGVVNQKYQFSTQDNGDPNEDCYSAVHDAIAGAGYPDDMYYFRLNKYHNWGTPIEINNNKFKHKFSRP